jgi:hypothetical protein
MFLLLMRHKIEAQQDRSQNETDKIRQDGYRQSNHGRRT